MGLGLFVDLLIESPLAYGVALFLMLFGIVLHNITQTKLADQFGDPKPRLSGFFKTDPSVHVSTFQLVLLVFLGACFPNSIPLNRSRFRSQPLREAVIWLSGPLALVAWAFVLFWVKLILVKFAGLPGLISGVEVAAGIMVKAAVVYCIPIPPLDGAKALFVVGDANTKRILGQLEMYGPMVFLLVFLTLGQLGILDALTLPIYWVFQTVFGWMGLDFLGVKIPL